MAQNDTAGRSAQEKMLRAKFQLRKAYPFFAYLAVFLEGRPMRAEEAAAAPGRMGVSQDGDLSYDEVWVRELPPGTLMAVLCHEVLHLALGHFQRMAGRSRDGWNIAADIKINDILNGEQLGRLLPRDGYVPDANHCMEVRPGLVIGGVDCKSTEAIYNELMRSGPLPGGWQEGAGGWEFHPWNGQGATPVSDAAASAAACKWRGRVMDAVRQAERGRGTLSAGLLEALDRTMRPRVPWTEVLRRHLTQLMLSDYSFHRPRRSAQALGLLLPGVVRESIRLVYHKDTSGSMSTEQLQQSLAEMAGILSSFGHVRMTCLVGDAALQDEFEFDSSDASALDRLQVKGRGGTSHVFVADWMRLHPGESDVLVSFTDGCSDIPEAYKALPEGVRRIIVLSGHDPDGTRAQMLAPYAEIIPLEV